MYRCSKTYWTALLSNIYFAKNIPLCIVTLLLYISNIRLKQDHHIIPKHVVVPYYCDKKNLKHHYIRLIVIFFKIKNIFHN